MELVRTIEDVKRYFGYVIDGYFNLDLTTQLIDLVVKNEGDKQQIFGQCTVALKGKRLSVDKCANFCEVVFQLNDYKQLLKNYVEFLLFTKHFEHLSVFLSRLFVSQIGNYKYRGMAQSYTLTQRYFDRFVEIVKFCGIEKEYYISYFLAIFKSEPDLFMFNYKEPLKEYLALCLKENEDGFINLLIDDNNIDGLEYFLKENTAKTIKIIIDRYISRGDVSLITMRKLIYCYRRESFNNLEGYLNDRNADFALRAVQLLNVFRDDRQIYDRLNSLKNTTTNEKVEAFLEKEIGSKKFVAFKNEQEFNYYLNATYQGAQERLYGVRLKTFYQKYKLNNNDFEGKTISFVLDTLKNEIVLEDILDLKSYFAYVDEGLLLNLSALVLEIATQKNKLISSKWALRLIGIYCNEELFNQICSVLQQWIGQNKTSSVNYLLEVMSRSGNKQIIDISKYLFNLSLTKIEQKNINKWLQNYCQQFEYSADDIVDLLADDFGLNENCFREFKTKKRLLRVCVTTNLQVKVTNLKNNKPARLSQDVVSENINVKDYVKKLEKQIKVELKRFYKAFLQFRLFTIEGFNNMLHNNLLNRIAESLIWGRYKNGKLYEIFRVTDKRIYHVYGTKVYEQDDDYRIALLHPLDIIDKLDSVKEMCGKSALNQYDFPVFDIQKYPSNAMWVESFEGLFCSAKLFIVRLQKLGYKINNMAQNQTYNSLVKPNANLNLLTVVQFDNVKLNQEENYSLTISRIMFYKLSALKKEGKNYLLSQGEALPLSALNPHIFSNELALISLACKN